MNGRLARLIKLLDLLSSGHAYNAGYLAEALGCSLRTVFRDLNALKSSGKVVYYDESRGGYRVGGQRQESTERLTADEVLAIAVAARTSQTSHLPHILPHLSQAVARLMIDQKPETREKIGLILRSLRSREACILAENVEGEVFDAVIRSLGERQCLRISYSTQPGTAQQSTKYGGYFLLTHCNELILIGRSSVHRRVMPFRMSSIHSATVLEDHYVTPPQYLKMGPDDARLSRILELLPTPMETRKQEVKARAV